MTCWTEHGLYDTAADYIEGHDDWPEDRNYINLKTLTIKKEPPDNVCGISLQTFLEEYTDYNEAICDMTDAYNEYVD